MSERHGRWTDRLSEYLDGSLHPDARRATQRHLAECGDCRRVLEELQTVVRHADDLGAVEPPRDLWPGVAAALDVRAGAASEAGSVIALPTAAQRMPPASTARVSLTAPQLAAASIALIAISAVTTLWAVSGPPAGVAPSGEAPAGAVVAVSEADPSPASLADELAQLEALLAAADEVLDANTIRILERNLDVIDRAIRDSREALALDPGNAFLARHLDRAYQRKLSYLREAAQIIDWAS